MSRSTLARSDSLALILAAACWGVGTVISKRALEEIPPFTLLAIQLAASLVVLGILMRLRGLQFRGGDAAPLLGRLGILNPGLAYALSLLGLASITASLSVLLWAFEPLMILILAGLVLRERIGPAIIVGSCVAVAGMLLVIYDPASTGHMAGVALTLAGIGCCAIYTVVARRWIGTSDSTAQIVATQQAYALAFAAAVLLVVSLLRGGLLPATVSPIAWLSAVGSGVLYYAAAYWFYLTGLRGVPASIAASTFYLIPVFGVAASMVLLGDHLEARQWVGVVVVLAAVVSITRRRAVEPLTGGAAEAV